MPKILKIKVSPNSSKNELKTMADGTLKVHLKAPPVDGKANEELIKFLSKEWKIPKSKILILKGLMSKNKIVEVK